MITSLRPEELLAYGARYRADYLFEQYGYTSGLAAAEGPNLAAQLPANYLVEMKSLADELNNLYKDKTLAAADAKISTKGQEEAVRQAKIWRRKVSHRALRAKRLGKVIPEEMLTISQARTVPALEGQINKLVKLFEAEMASLPGPDNPAVLAAGKAIATALTAADSAQELKHLKTLPDAVRAFYIKKGTMYLGLKAINDAGRDLYADDVVLASRYNLSILHRRHAAHQANPATPAATK